MAVTPEIRATCELAARTAGKLLLEFRGKFHVQEKGPADLVTDADFAAQKAIFAVIRDAFPDHKLIGEEDDTVETSQLQSADPLWIVDPLDGTMNYAHGLEHYCVSIAYHDNAKVRVGVIYDPVRDHCYSASLGGGAFLNGKPIATSQASSLSNSLISASFSPRAGNDEVDRFKRVISAAQGIRRLGSAALNLCYVASGKLDGYWATSLKAWDVAAGALIVKEAGGEIADLQHGGEISLAAPKLVAAANGKLVKELRQTLLSDNEATKE